MITYKMADVVKEISVRENNPATSEYDKFVGLEHYITGEVVIRQYGGTGMLNSAMKVFQAGDILVARRNVYLRRASMVDFDGLTSGDSIVLRAENPRIAKLLPFILNSDRFWDYADQHADGTMSKRLSPKILMQYEFTLPSEEEQDRLIELLWSMDRTKQAYKQLISATDELVKSQFIEMFGNCILNDRNWDVKPLRGVLSEGRTVTYGIVQTGDEVPNGIPVFRPVDISQGHIPVRAELKCTTKEISDKYKRTILEGNELLITVRGSIGETFLLTKEFKGCNVARNIVPLLPNPELLDRRFLKAIIDSTAFQHRLAELTKGIALKGINMNEFRDCPIILPPMNRQLAFISFFEQTDKSKFELTQALEALNATYKKLISENLG